LAFHESCWSSFSLKPPRTGPPFAKQASRRNALTGSGCSARSLQAWLKVATGVADVEINPLSPNKLSLSDLRGGGSTHLRATQLPSKPPRLAAAAPHAARGRVALAHLGRRKRRASDRSGQTQTRGSEDRRGMPLTRKSSSHGRAHEREPAANSARPRTLRLSTGS